MRPKIVILILAVAFCLLGIVALFRGVAAKHADESAGQPAAEVAGEPTAEVTNGPALQTSMNFTNTVTVSEDLRAVVVQRELDEINQLQGDVDGTNNSIIISALLAKMANPEADVRKAVVQALVALNDTNAVPGLEQAAKSIEDLREKVAVMDAIDFIKMPDITANLPAEFATNTSYVENSKALTRSGGTNSIRTSSRQKNVRAKNSNQQVAPPNAPANQPQ